MVAKEVDDSRLHYHTERIYSTPLKLIGISLPKRLKYPPRSEKEKKKKSTNPAVFQRLPKAAEISCGGCSRRLDIETSFCLSHSTMNKLGETIEAPPQTTPPFLPFPFSLNSYDVERERERLNVVASLFLSPLSFFLLLL